MMSANVHRRNGLNDRARDSKPERPGKSKSASSVPAREVQRPSGGKRSKSATKEKDPGKISVQFILERCQETICTSVFEINLQEQSLEDIPSLSEFTRLRILDLSCNRIRSISNLDNATELKELKLYSNEVGDLSGLERLKELSNLHLQHNKIQTIGKGLLALKKLKVLRLDSNRLTRINHREISCCSQLTVLDISSNRIADIAALNSLSCLEELDASNNRIVTLPDLGRCRKLQEIDLSRNQISEITGIKGCTNLMILKLSHNCISSLSSFGKLRKLQELSLSNNQLSKLEPVSDHFPSLEILNLSDNKLTSIEETLTALSGVPLVEFYATGNLFSARNSLRHHQLLQRLPSLEIMDGQEGYSPPPNYGIPRTINLYSAYPRSEVSLRRPSSSHGRAPPAMRPLSAAQILSTRQVEEQLKAAVQEQASFEASLSSRFNMVRDIVFSLPPEAPHQTPQRGAEEGRPASSGFGSRPSSRCSSRTRIAEARAFASEHFRPDQDQS